jgi:hypothetical protein
MKEPLPVKQETIDHISEMEKVAPILMQCKMLGYTSADYTMLLVALADKGLFGQTFRLVKPGEVVTWSGEI